MVAEPGAIAVVTGIRFRLSLTAWVQWLAARLAHNTLRTRRRDARASSDATRGATRRVACIARRRNWRIGCTERPPMKQDSRADDQVR